MSGLAAVTGSCRARDGDVDFARIDSRKWALSYEESDSRRRRGERSPWATLCQMIAPARPMMYLYMILLRTFTNFCTVRHSTR